MSRERLKLTSEQTIELLKATVGKPVAFNKFILGRVHPDLPEGYWSKQIDVLNSVEKHRITVVPAGHGVGKSHLLIGAAKHYLYTHPHSQVLILSPSYSQLENVILPKLRAAFENARVPLPGRMLRKPPSITIDHEWFLTCASADTDPEKIAGKHPKYLLVICDEASAKEYDKLQPSLQGLNAHRYLYLGNPIRKGAFSDLCDRADGDKINKIVISSLESPHATWERSSVGLADRTFIEEARLQYGEDSPYWRTRVLGQFADDADTNLVLDEWLNSCRDAPHIPSGEIRIAIDVASGRGGDKTVIAVLDDGGLYYLEGCPDWTWEFTASKVATLKERFKATAVLYDEGGVGLGFGNALIRAGVLGAKAFNGSNKATDPKKFYNCRAESYWSLRERLNPGRLTPETPFAISTAHLSLLRNELTAIRLDLSVDKVLIESKSDIKARIGRSPDFADSLMMAMRPARRTLQVF